jgi:polysaccharide biosynthesis protein PslG
MKNGWDRMLNARRIMVANGDAAKRIWITEFGGPTSGPRGSIQVLSEVQQSALLTSGFQRASQYPWVAMMSWFTYADDGGNPLSSPNGAWMGLLRANHSRKPAYATYQRLSALAT